MLIWSFDYELSEVISLHFLLLALFSFSFLSSSSFIVNSYLSKMMKYVSFFSYFSFESLHIFLSSLKHPSKIIYFPQTEYMNLKTTDSRFEMEAVIFQVHPLTDLLNKICFIILLPQMLTAYFPYLSFYWNITHLPSVFSLRFSMFFSS